jgi:citrate synthase
MSTETKIFKGLAGVVVDTTAISKVVPETNSLTYRGYPVQDLAAHCSFEQVAYLLWHGELPTDGQLALFSQRERASRRLDRSMLSLLAKLPDNCHPMDVVRTAISYLGAEDPEEDDSAEAANFAKSLRMSPCCPRSWPPTCGAGVAWPRSHRTATSAMPRTS